MNIAELKQELIHRINQTQDDELLMALSDFMKSFTDNEPYVMNEEQLRAVKEARTQYAKGAFLNDEEADKDIEKWVND